LSEHPADMRWRTCQLRPVVAGLVVRNDVMSGRPGQVQNLSPRAGIHPPGMNARRVEDVERALLAGKMDQVGLAASSPSLALFISQCDAGLDQRSLVRTRHKFHVGVSLSLVGHQQHGADLMEGVDMIFVTVRDRYASRAVDVFERRLVAEV